MNVSQQQTQAQPQTQPHNKWAAPFNSGSLVTLKFKEKEYVRAMRTSDPLVWAELGNPYELGVLDGLKRGRLGGGMRKVDW